MKLVQLKQLNWMVFLALVFGGLLLITTACGDDDDDGSGGSSASGSGGAGAGGAAGETGGSGGTAGETGGSGGTAGETGGSGGGGVPAATEAEKQSACQCMGDNGTFFGIERLVTVCQSNIPDACVACVNDIAAGASCVGMDAAAFDECVTPCAGAIPAPADAAECNEITVASGQAAGSEDLVACLCETCLDAFGSCLVDPICQEIMLCVAEVGCVSTECLNDEVCGPLINDALMGTGAASVATAVEVGTCQAACLGVSPDGGTPDGGMADGG